MSEETAQFPAGERTALAPTSHGPALVAVGIGGRIELAGDRLHLVKGGLFGHLVEILWLGHGVLENSIAIAEITAVEIVKTILLPSFIRISYAGGPKPSGRFLEDALAENALLMNLFDNRGFYRVKEGIEGSRNLALVADAAMSHAGRTTA